MSIKQYIMDFEQELPENLRRRYQEQVASLSWYSCADSTYDITVVERTKRNNDVDVVAARRRRAVQRTSASFVTLR
jgi:hypothetical protein